MPYIYNCAQCQTPCDGVTLGVYNFANDVEFSEHYENLLITAFNNQGFHAKKTERDGYPDIELYDQEDHLLRYIEVKVQRRSFMRVSQLLPQADLVPSETVALNLSDLLRYFEISHREPVPVFILWVLSERPCILGPGGEPKLFIQNVQTLEPIYRHYGDQRRFRRRSGRGDVVNGVHRGVVVNYHFSLQELHPFRLELYTPDRELPPEG